MKKTRDETKATDGSDGAHVASLDGVRFVAFLGVFAWHALQHNRLLGSVAKYGALGVQVFFVLSGFLIGAILLGLRDIETATLGAKLKIFYARRSLRIFPLYYLTLILLVGLEWAGVEWIGGSQYFFWNAAYLTNVKLFLGDMGAGGLAHFWTLSVEEHFYMVAPLLMLTMSVRNLSLLCVASWLFAGAGRVFFHSIGRDNGILLSPMQFDCMTVGIAVALLQTKGEFLGLHQAAAHRLFRVAAWALGPILLLRFVPGAAATYFGLFFEQWVLSVAVSGLLVSLWTRPKSVIARVFSFGPMPYLGKISYGLYVFHLPCLVISAALFTFMPHGNAIPAFVMTVALAMLSFRFFESPINDLKRHFSYRSLRQR